MVQHPIQVEELVRSVLVEIRFGNILAIQRIVLVELDDPLDQRRLVSKIDVIEKTLRIEFAVDQGIAPINRQAPRDRKSTRLNSSHSSISYAVFCLKKKKKKNRKKTSRYNA